MAGAVHRLDREVALLRLGGEHVLLVVLPVTGAFPQAPVEDHRAAYFLIAVVLVDAAHVLLDLLPERPALGVPEDHPRRLILQMAEVELPTGLAVAALLRFLEPC